MRALVAGGSFEKEKHIAPAAGKQPHITFILLECVPPSPRAAFRGGGWGLLGPSGVADSPRCSDYGWADAGWHRIDDRDPSKDVMTPNMNQLVKEGIEMDRQCESASGALLSDERATLRADGLVSLVVAGRCLQVLLPDAHRDPERPQPIPRRERIALRPPPSPSPPTFLFL